MQVRVMRVPMPQATMLVQVRVRLAPVPARLVVVPVMRVVHMLMRVRHWLVQVVVLMALGQGGCQFLVKRMKSIRDVF